MKEFETDGESATIENPRNSDLRDFPCIRQLIDEGWVLRHFNTCMLGARLATPTALLCSPGSAPSLWKTCVYNASTGLLSCGHTARVVLSTHLRLGDDYPTAKAAEYCDGLVEAWATDIAIHADFLKPGVLHHKIDTESSHRVRRHILRGEDPDTAREIRERENLA